MASAKCSGVTPGDSIANVLYAAAKRAIITSRRETGRLWAQQFYACVTDSRAIWLSVCRTW